MSAFTTQVVTNIPKVESLSEQNVNNYRGVKKNVKHKNKIHERAGNSRDSLH